MSMTPKQEEGIRNKIKRIKAALAADKRRWGDFHHDGQGLRYAPPRLYVQLNDYSGGLKYLKWFDKYFPDDIGYPDFLFEWTVILFKTGRLKEAERKAFQAFTRNTYLFDKFFGRPINKIDKWEGSNLEVAEFATKYFHYSCNQDNLSDFADWLDNLIHTESFLAITNKYLEIYKRMKNERDVETRRNLGRQAEQLENEI
jgi:tetratricopeptide (TPR) repeat protein